MVRTGLIQLSTRGSGDVINITTQVEEVLNTSGIQNGIVTIFTSSATSALSTLEYEPGCVKDLQRLFNEIIPVNRDYAHNMRWGDGNGHSHVRAALLKPSLTIPFVNQHMTLGTWQQIIFVDFDNRSRRRELVIQMIGE
jgi:secondary thiamine-phosphate synthase enzyme